MTETITSPIEPSLAKVKLRSDVTHSLRTSGGEPFVMVQDPIHSQFYRLGVKEWRLAKLFDGTKTLRQVAATIQEQPQVDGSSGASPEEVVRLAHWLTQSGLADVVEGALRVETREQHGSGVWIDPLQQAARWGAWNPLFMRVTLPDPQPFLRVVYPCMSWLFSPVCLLVWIGVCLAGALAVGSEWSRFTSSLMDVFAPSQWLYLMLIWLSLKFVHELGHAVYCERLGGRVTRCGLMFILFSPIAWVDVTSAWAFRSKWQRIGVSAAGMYLEFFVAGIAALVWANTTSPWLATLSRNVVLAASLTSVLFNLNILMRFDGYFILADLLDIQNLYPLGQQFVQHVQRRYLLGLRSVPLKITGWRLWFIGLYGWAAMAWRIVFYVGIVIVAAKLFHGAGLVLGVFSGLLWFALPFAKFCVVAWLGSASEPPRRGRFATVMLGFALLLAVGFCMPWPGHTRAHGYVEYSPLQVVRTDRGGFVREILVESGDTVSAGQIIARLENVELTRKLADLRLQIEIQELQQRVMHREHDMGRYAAVAEKIRSLQQQRDQVADQIDALTVRAPIAGEVIANELDAMLGTYLRAGQEILSVGASRTKEVRVSIPQQEVEQFREAQDRDVRLRFVGHPLRSSRATFAKVTPKATRRLLHPALAATAGGPLAVQAAGKESSDEQVLVEENFEGIVQLPEELACELRSGELCTVSLGAGYQRVYEKLWSLGRDYLANKS